MASVMTIRCRDAEEARTLLSLMEQFWQADGRQPFGLSQTPAVVEAVVPDGRMPDGGKSDGGKADGREADHGPGAGFGGTAAALPDVVQVAAQAIAALIVRRLEPALLEKLIARRVMDMGEEEWQELLQLGIRMLHGSEDGDTGLTASRQAGIIRRVAAWLREQPNLDVHGFYRFRLPDYRMDVAEAVDAALEEFAADRQYREFIALLKAFVYFQEVKIPIANVIHCGDNRYAMLDHRMQPLEQCGSQEVTVEEVDRAVNYEDMIVSTLISASPRHIFIHTREPDTLSIRTIRHIFEGRTSLCTDCHLCRPLMERKEGRGLP